MEAARSEQLLKDLATAVISLDRNQSVDFGGCPYLLGRIPGNDRNEACQSGCHSEPLCETWQPPEGWPLYLAHLALHKLGRNGCDS
jgi:hypothetical protein